MALSHSVKESINAASGHLREAIAFGSRVEHPVTLNALIDCVSRLETIETLEQAVEKYAANQFKPNGSMLDHLKFDDHSPMS